jgi:hypothetical protein
VEIKLNENKTGTLGQKLNIPHDKTRELAKHIKKCLDNLTGGGIAVVDAAELFRDVALAVDTPNELAWAVHIATVMLYEHGQRLS